jgi:hypothetical protein
MKLIDNLRGRDFWGILPGLRSFLGRTAQIFLHPHGSEAG